MGWSVEVTASWGGRGCWCIAQVKRIQWPRWSVSSQIFCGSEMVVSALNWAGKTSFHSGWRNLVHHWEPQRVNEGGRCVGWEDVGNFSPGWPIPWGRGENFHALCVGFLLQKEGNFGPGGLSREQTKSRDVGLVHHSWQGGLNEAASSWNVVVKARGLISISKSLMSLPTSVHGLSATVGTRVTWGWSSGQGVRARGSCSFWATVSFAMLLGCCFYPLWPSQQPCLPCPWL